MASDPTNLFTLVWSVVGAVAAAVVSFVVFAARVGRKLQIMDDLKNVFEAIQRDVKDLIGRVSKIEGRLFGVAIPGSPLKLTPLGLEILHESGILDIVAPRRQALIEKIKAKNPPTAYDVQELTKNIFERELAFTAEEEAQLKDYAYRKGILLQEVLTVGALYFRDIALEELGMRVEPQETTHEQTSTNAGSGSSQ